MWKLGEVVDNGADMGWVLKLRVSQVGVGIKGGMGVVLEWRVGWVLRGRGAVEVGWNW